MAQNVKKYSLQRNQRCYTMELLTMGHTQTRSSLPICQSEALLKTDRHHSTTQKVECKNVSPNVASRAGAGLLLGGSVGLLPRRLALLLRGATPGQRLRFLIGGRAVAAATTPRRRAAVGREPIVGPCPAKGPRAETLTPMNVNVR
jgi:hypothetical protein